MKTFGKILIALSVIITIVGIFFAVLVGHEKNLINSMAQIKRAYSDFSIAVIQNYDNKDKLHEKILNFDVETFKDERASFEEVANTYTKGVKTMAANVDFLEKKCHIQYEDISVNIMCQNYQFLYENMTNAYVREIKLYNQKITEYNSNGEGTFELYEGVKSEFIDFNNDGKYESSKDEIEKPKEETNKTTTE